MSETLTSAEATRRLRDGTAPVGMIVDSGVFLLKVPGAITIPEDSYIRHLSITQCAGDIHWPRRFACDDLDIWDCNALTSLPANLSVTSLDVVRCPNLSVCPDDLFVTQHLQLSACPELSSWPRFTRLHTLAVRNCQQLPALAAEARVVGNLTVVECDQWEEIAIGREALNVEVSECRNMRRLPAGLQARYLNISGCEALAEWDDPAITELRQLDAQACRNLRRLPPNLVEIDELDVSGCANLAELPPNLVINSWVDIGGTQIRALPQTGSPAQIRWHGVAIDGRVALHPETLTAARALAEPNAEIRRVMIERMGLERFLAEAQPETLDADRDPGGPRRLLRVVMPRDQEDLVALHVHDPSTGRMYLLRVPPQTQTCRAAAAWIAGFDDPDLYAPVVET